MSVSSNIKTVVVTMFVTAVAVYGVLAPFLISPQLNFALGSESLWVSIGALCTSMFLIYFVFVTRGASSRNVLFIFGCLIVLSAAVSYGSLAVVIEHSTAVAPFLERRLRGTLSNIQYFAAMARDLISFGIAAFGANVAASAAVELRAHRDA